MAFSKYMNFTETLDKLQLVADLRAVGTGVEGGGISDFPTALDL